MVGLDMDAISPLSMTGIPRHFFAIARMGVLFGALVFQDFSLASNDTTTKPTSLFSCVQE